MNDVITLSGVELLALGKEARQRYSYMDYEISKYPPAKPGALILLAPQRGNIWHRLKAVITSPASAGRNEHPPSLDAGCKL